MTRHSFLLDEQHESYLSARAPQPTSVQRDLIVETARLPTAGMQIAPEQGAFLQLLVKITGAQTILEVGTFTGYSALAMALVLPDDGRLIACDVSEEWTAIAQRHWKRAGVADRIELHIGPAAETIASLPSDLEFDMAFIDADKPGYVEYMELTVPRLRSGGLLVADNVLWDGRVVDGEADDHNTVALRNFNDAAKADERLWSQILPLFDGLLIAMKR